MKIAHVVVSLAGSILVAGASPGCGAVPDPDDGGGGPTGVSLRDEALKGCHGKAAKDVPASGAYYLTSFGAGADAGVMSCGSNTSHGSWYYAASRQRYGCGAHVRIEANGRCVIAQTDDYGPDVCVETVAGGPIMDVSPLVSQHLFGSKSAGWSDHFEVTVTKVGPETALGPCVVAPAEPAEPACGDDFDCNAGEFGTARVCAASEHVCIDGCHTDWDCPGLQTCEATAPHWSCQ